MNLNAPRESKSLLDFGKADFFAETWEHDREHVRLADGFNYTIEHAKGNIIDAEGKLIGKPKDGGNGTKLLVGKNDEVIREFQTDGSIISVTT